MIAKIYLHYISIFFLYFLHNLFFLLMSFSTPHHGQNPFNQIIKKWLPKYVSVDLLEKYLDMNAGLWSGVCVRSWIFENVFENFWIVYKIADEWYIEWQRVVQRVITSDNEWQRMTTNDNEWQHVVQRVTTSDNEWQRATKNHNEWYNEWYNEW